MKIKVLLIWSLALLLCSCISEEIDSPHVVQSNTNFSVYITTPDEIQVEGEVRASHDGPHDGEGRINSLWLLVFDGAGEDNTLLEKKAVTYTTVEGTKINGKVELDSPSNNNTTIRFLANTATEDISVGQTWTEIRKLTYAVNNGNGQLFPMTGEIQTNFRTQTSIGTEQNRIRLIRSLAKITFNIQEGGDFQYLGNRVFRLKDKGFVFPTPENDAPNEAEFYNEAGYNKYTVTYSAERLNVAEEAGDEKLPLDNRTFFMLHGRYKGKEGFYRIDFYNEAKKEYLNFTRNTNYNLKVTVNGYGFDTEAEALEHPLNGSVVHIIADVSDAYNFITNGAGNFLGFSNLAVTIYGKPTYFTRGFAGNKTRYEYVLTTITNEKNGGWDSSDITILNAGSVLNSRIVVVDKYDEFGKPVPGMKEYLLVGSLPDNFKAGDETSVTVKYTTLAKDIKVRREQYIDCHFTNIAYPAGTASPSVSDVRLMPTRKSDGGYVENGKFPADAPTHLSWVMLADAPSTFNCRSTDYKNRTTVEQWRRSNNGPVRIQFHEHLNTMRMGRFAAKNAELEGFRFADVYVSLSKEGERHKLILAQANADLVGFFGHESIRPDYARLAANGRSVSGNYGPDKYQYDRYLVVERTTDTYITGSLKNIADYCRSHSPADIENLWYAPSYSQLLGVWVADNSDSRHTSPFRTEEMAAGGDYSSPAFPYFARSNFNSTHETAYPQINEQLPPLFGDTNVPCVNFVYGETMRGYHSKEYIAVRCVRNLDPNLEPDGLTNNNSPVSAGHEVTMDPKDFLSDDYFTNDSWNEPQIRNNKVARKFWVDPTHRSEQNVYRFTANPPRYTSYSRRTENVEGEVTFNAATREAGNANLRLPTMRELNLIYIYKDYLEQNSRFEKFNVDMPDASGMYSVDAKFPRILRYPAAGASTAPTYFYWSSTLRNPDLTYPMRMSMVVGYVNTRGAGYGEDDQLDHRRFVKTIK